MLRYKGFDSALFADDMAHLEASVNEWLQRQHPRIRFMTQSARGDHYVLSFLYDGGEVQHQPARASIAPEMLRRDENDEEELDDGDMLEDPGLPEAELPY